MLFLLFINHLPLDFSNLLSIVHTVVFQILY
nr:MAG TPA: hypothetical protein [Caudoviricetes sp.]